MFRQVGTRFGYSARGSPPLGRSNVNTKEQDSGRTTPVLVARDKHRSKGGVAWDIFEMEESASTAPPRPKSGSEKIRVVLSKEEVREMIMKKAQKTAERREAMLKKRKAELAKKKEEAAVIRKKRLEKEKAMLKKALSVTSGVKRASVYHVVDKVVERQENAARYNRAVEERAREAKAMMKFQETHLPGQVDYDGAGPRTPRPVLERTYANCVKVTVIDPGKPKARKADSKVKVDKGQGQQRREGKGKSKVNKRESQAGGQGQQRREGRFRSFLKKVKKLFSCTKPQVED